LRPLTPNSGPNFWDGRYLGSVVESVLRSRCRTSKELGRTLSPCDAPVPVKAADRAYGNRACSRFFRSPRAAGTIGRRSAHGLKRTPPGRTGPCRRVFEKANSLNDPTNQEAINKLSDTSIHRA